MNTETPGHILIRGVNWPGDAVITTFSRSPSGTGSQGAIHPALPGKAPGFLNLGSSVGCRANLHGEQKTDIGRAWHVVSRSRLGDGFLNRLSAV
jgi:hypothetical protein